MGFSPDDEPEIEAASPWPVVIWCFATTAPLSVPVAIKLLSEVGLLPSPSFETYSACSFYCGVCGWIAAAVIFMQGEGSKGSKIFGVACSTLLILTCANLCMSMIAIRKFVAEAPPKPRPPVESPVGEEELRRREMPDGIVKELQN
jgi:hypothetical protein